MENITMTNATPKPRVLFACPQVADRTLFSAIRGMGQGTGVSASAIGGAVGAVRTTGVGADLRSYATPKSLTNDVAQFRPGRPPV